MSENEDSTMSEESDAETSSCHQKEDIFGKYEDKNYGIHDDSDTDCTDEDDETNIILEKRASLILGHFLLMELIVCGDNWIHIVKMWRCGGSPFLVWRSTLISNLSKN